MKRFDGKRCDVCGLQANNMRVGATSPDEEHYWCDNHVPNDFGWWNK